LKRIDYKLQTILGHLPIVMLNNYATLIYFYVISSHWPWNKLFRYLSEIGCNNLIVFSKASIDEAAKTEGRGDKWFVDKIDGVIPDMLINAK